LGIQGFKYNAKDSIELWLKPLDNCAWAITLLNRSQKTNTFAINWDEFLATDAVFNRTIDSRKQRYKIRDIWTQINIDVSKKNTTFVIPKHNAVKLLLTKT